MSGYLYNFYGIKIIQRGHVRVLAGYAFQTLSSGSGTFAGSLAFPVLKNFAYG